MMLFPPGDHWDPMTHSSCPPVPEYIRGPTLSALVVTEYGVANLKFKSVRERAKALIAIAHPDFFPWRC